jgi:hypothetical protein
MTPSEIEPATLRLVAQCLNQLEKPISVNILFNYFYFRYLPTFYLFGLMIKEAGSSKTSLLTVDLSKGLHGVTYHMQVTFTVTTFTKSNLTN